ncbi:MAG: EAL domain-containing protein [Gammaproteobacteria bacterium]|nr:EAL domain-containing protein [Gammaproteobacteria bacterium]
MVPLAGLAVLLFAAGLLVQQLFHANLQEARADTERELQLLSSLVQINLQSGNYQYLEDTLSQFGKTDRAIVELRVVSDSGFSFTAYRRPTPAEHPLPLKSTIDYSYRGTATLTLVRDLAEVYDRHTLLVGQLLGGFAVVAFLLGFLFYVIVLRQREAEKLRERTRQLDSANRALEEENAQRRRAEEALFEAKERAEVTLHSIGDAVITTDSQGLVEYLNPVAEQLTGWSTAHARKRPLEDVFCIFNEVTRVPVQSPVARVLREGCIVGLANHTVLIARDGREIAIEDSAAPIRNRAGVIMGVILVFHDVSTARELAHQLSWQATHDALTGLVNRREFEKRLTQMLDSAHRDNCQHALLYLDLDQFKVVNDTCGHVAGDELLRQLSRLKQGHLRTGDTLARLGGDEFGILLENCPLDRAMQIAEALREATSDFRFIWQDYSSEIGVSIGVVPIHAASPAPHEVLAAADMACYMAKESGRNRIHLYLESDSEIVQRHGEMLWVSRLNAALKENRFVLYRQAIAPTIGQDGTPHCEVLIRLRDEQGALIHPGVFLPAAERFNLMPAIDRWVVSEVLAREIRQPCCDADVNCMIAINLSGASLGDERFLAFLREALTNPAINTKRLCFEITETAAINNLSRAADFMRELKTFGCQFALDDFGSGLSSFGYLKNLPVDFLKIDGALVKGVVESLTDLAMVNAINEIGHTLGIRTIAEFVENVDIRDRMAQIGVDYVQGYGVEHPRPFDD